MSLPRDFEKVLAAGVAATIEHRGHFIGVIDAPLAAIDVDIDGNAPGLRVGPGGSILSQEKFRAVRLTSAIAQTVRVRIADEVQDVSNIVTGSGGSPTVNVTVTETPSSTVTTPAPVTVADADAETIAANASRKRITIAADEANVGPVYVQAVAAGAGRGIPLAAGTYVEIRTFAALDVRNDTGAAAIFTTFEEE